MARSPRQRAPAGKARRGHPSSLLGEARKRRSPRARAGPWRGLAPALWRKWPPSPGLCGSPSSPGTGRTRRRRATADLAPAPLPAGPQWMPASPGHLPSQEQVRQCSPTPALGTTWGAGSPVPTVPSEDLLPVPPCLPWGFLGRRPLNLGRSKTNEWLGRGHGVAVLPREGAAAGHGLLVRGGSCLGACQHPGLWLRVWGQTQTGGNHTSLPTQVAGGWARCSRSARPCLQSCGPGAS